MGDHDNLPEHILFAILGILVAIWIAHSMWVRLDRIEGKVDHIERHYQAPEPTPVGNQG